MCVGLLLTSAEHCYFIPANLHHVTLLTLARQKPKGGERDGDGSAAAVNTEVV